MSFVLKNKKSLNPNPSSLISAKKGFTLIEILIVIAIIGILASIILVGLGSFRARGRDARRTADLREAQNALELYYTKNDQYPAAAGVNSWQNMSGAITGAGIGVSSVANDPLSPARSYEYGAGPGNQSYVLKATLEDSNNPVLKDDADGTIFNINCDDQPTAGYCVRF